MDTQNTTIQSTPMTESKQNCNKCMICLEVIEQDHNFLPCAHVYHNECVRDWLKEKPICPICKIPIFIESQYELDRYKRLQAAEERDRAREARYLREMVSIINRVHARSAEPNINTNQSNIDRALVQEQISEPYDSDDDLPELEPAEPEQDHELVERLVSMILGSRGIRRSLDPHMGAPAQNINGLFVRIPMSAPDQMVGLIPQPELDQVPDLVSDTIPDFNPDQFPDLIPNQGPEPEPEQGPEPEPEQGPEPEPEQGPEC